MSRAVICLLLVFATLASPAFGLQNYPAGSDERTLIDIERAWNTAVYERDAATIENILAEEFVATYDDGSRGDKAKELSLVREFNQRVISAGQHDFSVQVYGDTAVVWFRLNLVGVREGEMAEASFSFTDVFVRRDGRWQCVSSQSTQIDAG